MTGALVVSSVRDGQAPVTLSPIGARRLTDQIRCHLGTAIEKLAEAREGGADEALGYRTWHEYVIAEFGDLRELRLPTVERRALAASMHDSGMTYRAIRDKLDVSLGTIRNDIGREATGTVTPLHDPGPDPYKGMTRADEVVARVRAQQDRGLTCRELELETGWHHGVASGALSRVHRQHRVVRTDTYRNGYAAYTVED